MGIYPCLLLTPYQGWENSISYRYIEFFDENSNTMRKFDSYRSNLNSKFPVRTWTKLNRKNLMSEKELTEAALAENIFRINHWIWLKPKKSKIVVTVFEFQKKFKDVQCKDFWMFLVEASEKFAFSKIFWQRNSSHWVPQIGSNLLCQFFETVCLIFIWLLTNLEVDEYTVQRKRLTLGKSSHNKQSLYDF